MAGLRQKSRFGGGPPGNNKGSGYEPDQNPLVPSGDEPRQPIESDTGQDDATGQEDLGGDDYGEQGQADDGYGKGGFYKGAESDSETEQPPKRLNPSEVGKRESDAESGSEKTGSDGIPYIPGAGQLPGNKLVQMVAGRITKRNGYIGGVTGFGIGIALFFGISSLGPLELINLSHSLQKSFSRSDKESSSRISELFRYARYRSTGDISETHLGKVGSKIYGGAKSTLADSGVEFDKNELSGRPTNINIDQEKLGKAIPEFADLDPGSPQAKSLLAEKLGVDPSLIESAGEGKFTVNVKGLNIKALRLVTKNSTKLLGSGKLMTALKARSLLKAFDLPSMLHPFSKARAAAINKSAEAISARKQAKGEAKAQADREAAKEAAAQEQQDNFTKTVQDPFTAEAKTNLDKIKGAYDSVSGTLIKGLTVTGLACIARNTAGAVAAANQALIKGPATVAAMTDVAAGQQTEATGNGKTTDGGNTPDQTSAQEASYSGKDGNIYQAAAMQSLIQPDKPATGVALPTEYEQAFDGKSKSSNIKAGIDDIINSTIGQIPGLSASTICSPAGLLIQAGGAILLTVGSEFLSGGLATPALAAAWGGKFVANTAIAMVAMTAATSLIEHYATDGKLDSAIFSSPIGGALIAFGSRNAANVAAVANGGISLGNDKSTMPDPDGEQAELDTFKSQSTFARVFSKTDPNSLMAHMAMAYSTSGISTGGIRGVADAITGIGSSFGSMLSSLVPKAAADGTNDNGFDWKFPQYGIPDTMLNDPQLADPYANADDVAKVLDGSDGQNYIDKAAACFGVKIEKNGDGEWDVTHDTTVDTSSSDYTDAGCNEQGTGGKSVDTMSWRRTIMYVFDTGTMNAAACSQSAANPDDTDDQTACSDIGMGASADSANTDTTTGPTGNPITASGTAAQIATRLLAEWGTHLKGDGGTGGGTYGDLVATSKGQTVDCGNGPVSINANLLQVMLTLTTKYDIQVSTILTGHDCSGTHSIGHAFDVGSYVDPATGQGSGLCAKNLDPDPQYSRDCGSGADASNPALDHNFWIYVASIMPQGGRLGQINCEGRNGITPPPNIADTFPDGCDHQHIDVGK